MKKAAKRNSVAALTMSLIAAAAAPVSARPLAEVMAAKSITIILYEDNKPFSWTDEGEAKGIEVELARAVAKDMGIEADVILRMNAERVDNDLRVNILRGTAGGGTTGDIMMNIPDDEDLDEKLKEIIIAKPYHREMVAVAIDPKRVPKDATFDLFKTEKIGVKIGTVADYFLMTYQDGVLVNNISHHVKGSLGAKEFLSGEVAAMMGMRSEIEGLLHEQGTKSEFITPDMDGIVRRNWTIGIAYKDDSLDLGDAVGKSLERLEKSGETSKIFAKYGVTHVPPNAK